MKNVRGYQLLQAFIVFTCKKLPKNFRSCKAIREERECFSPQMKSNIWCSTVHAYNSLFIMYVVNGMRGADHFKLIWFSVSLVTLIMAGGTSQVSQAMA